MARSDTPVTLLPGPSAVVFFLWVVFAIGFLQPTILSGDGDPARHISHGLWILDHGSLIHNDPFSYTRPGEAFVGFEYGTQLLFGLLHRAGGLAGIMGFTILLTALIPALVTTFLLRRRVDPALAMLGGMLSGAVALIHFIARPHMLTLVLTLVLLEWLERDRRPPWWAFGLLFVLWANLHGGVLFGLVLVGLYLAAELPGLLSRERRAAAVRSAGLLAALLAIGVAALFATPYGAGIPLHLVNFFGDPLLRENTMEFLSPDFGSPQMKLVLLVFLGMALALGWSQRRPPLRWLLVMVATMGFALLARRNVALFALTGMPLLFLFLDPTWRALPDWRGLRAGFAFGAVRSRSWPWMLAGTVAVTALALNGGEVLGVRVLQDSFDPETFPIAIVEEARSEGLEGHLFHEFTWGGWLLYAWPEQKVFIDGGTDFYGSDLYRTFLGIIRMQPGWRDSLDAYGIQHVLLRVDSPMGNELAREPEWGLRTCDATGMLLSRGLARDGREADVLLECYQASKGGRRDGT